MKSKQQVFFYKINCSMRINKWILIVLAINIGLLCFTIYAFRQYQHRQEIVKFAHPIIEYSLLEVDCHSSRMSSNIKIAYLGKEYFVGVTKKMAQTNTKKESL